MASSTTSELRNKDCQPCHGGIPPLTREQAQQLLAKLEGWKLTKNGNSIERKWVAKDFTAALAFFQRIGDVAEEQDHHPDLHLTGYKNVSVELTTHAINGLSENDFIMAAKIDALPPEGKS